MKIDEISHLCHQLLASSTKSSFHQQKYDYQSETFRNYMISNIRWTILPKFPPLSLDDKSKMHLLLSNVPFMELSLEEIGYRQHGYDHLISNDNINYYSVKTGQANQLFHELFLTLSQQWQVPISILVYNCQLMISFIFQSSSENVLVRQRPLLNMTLEDWKLALEIYLQMDINCFYLKTCSFRNSTPRSINFMSRTLHEGLFCFDSLEARYGMKRCPYRRCLFCHLPNNIQRCEPAIKYTDHQIHTFVNQYQAILNCDVTCFSRNVIYTLTCPCKQYDYIGRSARISFDNHVYFHRLECSRIIREFLLGKSIVQHFAQPSSKHDQKSNYNNMDLYRHVAHCHVALQLFLNNYRAYWCLIPMTYREADVDDLLYQYENERKIQPFDIRTTLTNDTRTDDLVYWCINHLPQPPDHYRFSQRQRQQQFQFFKTKLDCSPLSRHLDIYDASIVIALPDNSSFDLIYFVQTLLMVHTESKLNTKIPQIPSHFERSSNWCQHLQWPFCSHHNL